MNVLAKSLTPLLPHGLVKGDTIGLFAPAGPLPDKEIIRKGKQLLEEVGFQVKYHPNICRNYHYLAGSDQERLQEFITLWKDPSIKALLAVRGGYGSARILPEIDLDIIKKNPKLIIGFSDLTSLLNGLQSRTSLVSFHGPMLSTLVRDGLDSVKCLAQGITGEGIKSLQPKGIKVLREGRRSGRLMGGNLTTLVHLLGTPFEPDWQDTLFFIEDVAEPAYKIDRMLTHLHLAKRFEKVSGIILGGFTTLDNTTIENFELIEERILALTDHAIPVWCNFPVSHGPNNTFLPLGLQATMDSNSKTLTFNSRYFR